MFCSECGKPASGKFCSSCGAPLSAAVAAAPEVSTLNWPEEVNYEALVRVPEVRDILARQIPAAKTMSAEQFADAFQKITSNPLPLGPMLNLGHDLTTRLGLKTGKVRTQAFSRPPGRTIVDVLCSFIRNGQTMKTAQQATDGCMLMASIPSDLFSYEGDLIVTVQRDATGCSVSAATRITGQLYDWGKSSRCLDRLFSDLRGTV